MTTREWVQVDVDGKPRDVLITTDPKGIMVADFTVTEAQVDAIRTRFSELMIIVWATEDKLNTVPIARGAATRIASVLDDIDEKWLQTPPYTMSVAQADLIIRTATKMTNVLRRAMGKPTLVHEDTLHAEHLMANTTITVKSADGNTGLTMSNASITAAYGDYKVYVPLTEGDDS